MGVLTEREKEILAKVETTKVQATLIKLRNERLLELLKNRRPGEINIGCPHCNPHFACLGLGSRGIPICSWMAIREDIGFTTHTTMLCCAMTFGGVSYTHIQSLPWGAVGYGHDHAEVYGGVACLSPEDEQKAVTFLQGHIEWADIVLNGPGE